MDKGQYWVGSIPFVSTTLPGAARWLINASSAGNPPGVPGFSVRLANAYCVALASTDKKYGDLLRNGGVNFPDGTPVWGVMACLAFLGRSGDKPGRVRGPSFFKECLAKGRDRNLRHFFLGGTEDSLASLLLRVREEYPGIRIAGGHAPAFGPVDDSFISEQTQRILAAKPDIVWVGLGTPKQDFATTMLAKTTGVNCVGVGAAFDFMAGLVPEAPLFFQKSGTEWLYRLFSEPKRLWKRYTLGNAQFFVAVASDLIEKSRPPR